MREILFRGKRLDSQGWMVGDLLQYIKQKDVVIFVADAEVEEAIGENVYPETVGQYTGLNDMTGKKIFEGDIVETPKFGVDDGRGRNYPGKDNFLVGFENGTYFLQNKNRRFCLRPDETVKIIGNIHDNPEMFEPIKK